MSSAREIRFLRLTIRRRIRHAAYAKSCVLGIGIVFRRWNVVDAGRMNFLVVFREKRKPVVFHGDFESEIAARINAMEPKILRPVFLRRKFVTMIASNSSREGDL